MTQFQGRKVQSQVGHRAKPNTGIGKSHKDKKRYEKKNQSNIAMPPAFAKRNGKKLRPKGTGANVPLSRKTWCEFCCKHVTDVPQHNRTKAHEAKRLLDVRWKFCTECNTPWQEQQLHVCVPARESLVERSKMWNCATCNISIPADPQSVHDHERSHEHLRMKSYDANVSRPDGSALASQQRERNDTAAAKTHQRRKRKATQNTALPDLSSDDDINQQPQQAADGKNDVCRACGVHRHSMLADVIDVGGGVKGASSKPTYVHAASLGNTAAGGKNDVC